MTTGVTVTVLLAALTVLLGWRTLQSQKSSEKVFQDMNDVLHQMQVFQQALDARDLRFRQERARQAVEIVINAFRRQVSALDGQWVSLPLKADPLEPIRVYEVELAWVPACEWKNQCKELLRSIDSLPLGAAEGKRGAQRTALTNGSKNLAPAGQLRLYEDCLKAIDEMD